MSVKRWCRSLRHPGRVRELFCEVDDYLRPIEPAGWEFLDRVSEEEARLRDSVKGRRRDLPGQRIMEF